MKKVIVLTGASSGLGKEIALLFSQKEIYHLILSGRNENGLEPFKDNPNISLVIGDITENETIDAIELKIKEQGRIDVLINNAGIALIKPFEKNTDEEVQNMIDIDLKAPIQLTQRLYPYMLSQQAGHIVMINSTTGKVAKPNESLYSAAKFGLRGFTDALRLEAKQHGIRVTGFHPGGMNTNFYDELTGVPIEKFMDPKKIAEILINLIETDPALSPEEIVINRMTK